MKKFGSVVLVLCILCTSISVSAGVTENFGAGESRGVAELFTGHALIEAYTRVDASSVWYSAGVQCRSVYQDAVDESTKYSSYYYGEAISSNVFYTFMDAPQFVVAGESYHYIDGMTRHLYCAY